MRRIFTILLAALLFVNAPYAQKFVWDEKNVQISQATMYNENGQTLFFIGVKPDDHNTKFYYPNNNTNNDKINFGYYVGTKTIRINFIITDKVNFSDLRYKIVENDTNVITNWSPLPHKKLEAFSTDSLSFLEKVNCENKVLSISMYDINKPEYIITQIISTKPVVISNVSAFINYESIHEIMNDTRPTVYIEVIKNMNIDTDNRILTATVTLKTENSPYLYKPYLIRDFNGEIDTISTWDTWRKANKVELMMINDFAKESMKDTGIIYAVEFPGQLMTEPGLYKLIVIPGLNEKVNNSSDELKLKPFSVAPVELKFSIRKPLVSIKNLLLILSLVVFTGLSYFLYQRRKLTLQKQKTNEAKLKLQSIRSQLNPHFIFNALSGIQTLMNKNETEKANQYLGTFSRLTRNVLDDSNKDLISLDNEIKLLHDYLKMEQLRFGFQYDISADEALDRHNIEIPAMLLQPFAENAVKHGVAALKENGIITIGFKRSGNDIVMSVTDNGNGFDVLKEYNGMGLHLSKNRISLLNTVYKTTPLDLRIDSSADGTTVNITLQNWLS